MSDQDQQQGQRTATGVVIPDAVQQAHPKLIELILQSESMNDEERQYWVDILPVMTADQIQQLETILVNERDQLAAIDQKYAQSIPQEKPALRPISEIGQERQKRASKRTAEEIAAETAEAETEEDILKKVQEL